MAWPGWVLSQGNEEGFLGETLALWLSCLECPCFLIFCGFNIRLWLVPVNLSVFISFKTSLFLVCVFWLSLSLGLRAIAGCKFQGENQPRDTKYHGRRSSPTVTTIYSQCYVSQIKLGGNTVLTQMEKYGEVSSNIDFRVSIQISLNSIKSSIL